jgi:HPt (histidine-containing phosphotransfer) domain-containing protein
LLSRLVEVFLADHRTTAADIAAALAAGEVECAHRLCHALSGTGATVGATNLQRVAAELEQALRRGVRPDAADVTRLRRVLAETRAVMSAWLTAPEANHPPA